MYRYFLSSPVALKIHEFMNRTKHQNVQFMNRNKYQNFQTMSRTKRPNFFIQNILLSAKSNHITMIVMNACSLAFSRISEKKTQVRLNKFYQQPINSCCNPIY